MKLGCSTVLFNQLDIYGALQHIAWAGYEGAELAYIPNMVEHVELNIKQPYIEEVKCIAKKLGIRLFAIHTDVGDHNENRIKSMTILFDVAFKLSIPVVTISAGGKSDNKEITNEVLSYISKLCKLAESRGITLAIKCHPGHSIYNTDTLIQTLQQINSPALGVNLDPGNLYRAGEDPSESILRIGGRIVHTHFHDCPNQDQLIATPEQKIPGRGVLNFFQIITRLKAVGYDSAIDTQVTGALMFPLSRQMGIAAEARGHLNRCLQELTR